MRLIDASLFRSLVPMAAAIDALEAAFASTEDVVSPPRTVMDAGGADLLVMPAARSTGAGVKLVTVNPRNPERGLPLIHALYVLFDGDTSEPVALIDGEALTATRTAAVSAVATKHLAPADASRLVLFGAGTQARSHLEAMVAVRPVEHVTVISRSKETAGALAESARSMGLKATSIPGGSSSTTVEDVLARADLVCTCTTSGTPLFDGTSLAAGAHVNAVGAYTADTRELDDALIGRAWVVVETLDVATAEAGDVVSPLRAGALEEGDIAELGQVVRGERTSDPRKDVTVFKSVGAAFEDLAVALKAAEALED